MIKTKFNNSRLFIKNYKNFLINKSVLLNDDSFLGKGLIKLKITMVYEEDDFGDSNSFENVTLSAKNKNTNTYGFMLIPSKFKKFIEGKEIKVRGGEKIQLILNK